jgi:hypothetical protein
LHGLWLSPKAEEGEGAHAATNLNRKLQRKWTFFFVRIIIWSDFHLSEEDGEEEELGGLQIRMEAASSKRTIGIRWVRIVSENSGHFQKPLRGS